MSDWWKEWHEIKTLAKDRAIVFFGRSEDWIPKALNKITPICIVDNTRNMMGHTIAMLRFASLEAVFTGSNPNLCNNYCWYL